MSVLLSAGCLSVADPCRHRAVTLPELQSKLGDDSGTWLYETIRGLDNAEGESTLRAVSEHD